MNQTWHLPCFTCSPCEVALNANTDFYRILQNNVVRPQGETSEVKDHRPVHRRDRHFWRK
ncbi:LIM domain-containing protein [Undibacterium sp. TJN19]|uniref:LIM domain-containing protein n=1 Tax=Undibacterium sp. TJN19 TaxID=3413055 RepID=UPI003BF34944